VGAPTEAATSAAAFARPCRASIGAFGVALGRVSSDSSPEGGAVLGSSPYVCGGGANPGSGGKIRLGQVPELPPSPDEEGRAPALPARGPPAASGERCPLAAVEEKREGAEDGGPNAVEEDGAGGYTADGF
jgi:hypothetical protein